MSTAEPEHADAAPTAAGEDLVSDEPPTRSAGRVRHRRSRRRKPSIVREIASIVVAALVLAFLIKTFLVQSFSIPSPSMRDTLEVGDRILVSRLAPGPLDIHRGDIVVFTDEYDWLGQPVQRHTLGDRIEQGLAFIGVLPDTQTGHLVKRVIGLPGDTVECDGEGGPITVNGVAIDETYLKPGSIPSEVAFNVTVPDDSVWVMGDNRQDSGDSRMHQSDPNHGFVPMRNIVGVANVRTWPIDRWGVLYNPGEVFAGVPDPS